jgi:hypothetical protein
MQASVYGKHGVLSTLSRALRLESGILGKYRLSFADDFTVVFDDFLLAIFISWSFHQIDSTVRKKILYPVFNSNYYFTFILFDCL